MESTFKIKFVLYSKIFHLRKSSQKYNVDATTCHLYAQEVRVLPEQNLVIGDYILKVRATNECLLPCHVQWLTHQPKGSIDPWAPRMAANHFVGAGPSWWAPFIGIRTPSSPGNVHTSISAVNQIPFAHLTSARVGSFALPPTIATYVTKSTCLYLFAYFSDRTLALKKPLLTMKQIFVGKHDL